MNIAVIGNGAIAQYVQAALPVQTLLVRPERMGEAAGPTRVSRVADLPQGTDLVVDCAGHSALRQYGPEVLRAGFDLLTVSIGALADAPFYGTLEQAAQQGGAKLHLASGAIGALDCLRAAREGSLKSVRYVGRKPPQGWRGSPAEKVLDLTALTIGAHTHFEGTAREAALTYPKNANVAAAVALSGTGFDATTVTLIADAGVSNNIHEVHAEGDFGTMSFTISGATLPGNPRTSALAAMSVVASIRQRMEHVQF